MTGIIIVVQIIIKTFSELRDEIYRLMPSCDDKNFENVPLIEHVN